MSNEIIKNLETSSRYEYEGPQSTKGAAGVSGVPSDGEAGQVYTDQLAPSKKTVQPPKTPSPDSPDINITIDSGAHPSRKAITRRATGEEVKRNAVRTSEPSVKETSSSSGSTISPTKAPSVQGTSSSSEFTISQTGGNNVIGTIAANGWFQNPSWMVAFFSVVFELATVMSKLKFDESARKRETEMQMAVVGIESAELAKAEKFAQRDKEMMSAFGQMLNVAACAFQLASMPSSRGRAETRAKESEIGQNYTKQQDKLNDLKTNSGMIATDKEGKTIKLKELNELDPTQQKAIEAQRVKTNDARREYHTERQQYMQEEQMRLNLSKEMISALGNGLVEVGKALITQEEGVIAKERGVLEALLKTFNSLNDGNNKALDNLIQELKKLLDQLAQISEQNQRAFQLRG